MDLWVVYFYIQRIEVHQVDSLCLFFKQEAAYEMRISDWSSDVCSSDLGFPFFNCFFPFVYPWHHLFFAVSTTPFFFRHEQIGRASCRERVCQYVSISVVAVSLKKTLRFDNEIYK